MAKILNIGNEKSAREAALADLRAGKPVAIPTETVYGLAADATHGVAVSRIFAMKQRPSFNPLICHVSSLEMAKDIGILDVEAIKLAIAFWPGPLTMVVPRARQSEIHDLVTAGLDSVGIRWPRGASTQLISEFGKPLAAPSANRSGRISPTTAQHVADEFAGEELLVLDDGPCEAGIESTIVRLFLDRAVILRPGSITKQQLEAVLTIPVELHKTGNEHVLEGIQAPGMMASHYAPDAQVHLNVAQCQPDDALLAYGQAETSARMQAAHVFNLSETGNLNEAAGNLYAMLKQADALSPSRICVEPIPMEGVGIAINDRLERAAAPRQTS